MVSLTRSQIEDAGALAAKLEELAELRTAALTASRAYVVFDADELSQAYETDMRPLGDAMRSIMLADIDAQMAEITGQLTALGIAWAPAPVADEATASAAA